MGYYRFDENEYFDNIDNSLFQSYLSQLTGMNCSLSMPAIDIFEYESYYLLDVELPGGISSNEIKFQYVDRNLVITGCLNGYVRSKENKYLQIEMAQGVFTRVVHLSEAVEVDKITMQYSLGILTIKIPKVGMKTLEIIIEG